MENIMREFKCLCVSLSLLVVAVASASSANGPTVFDIQKYGARGDGRTDNTNAFLEAWKEACQRNEGSKLLIPKGTFYLKDVTFSGPCKGPINFEIKGTLLAPKNPNDMKQDTWIVFQYVDYLNISGSGTLDGQGSFSWPLNDCHKNSNCQTLAMTMGFNFVKHATLSGIKSLNSKNGHFNIFSVEDLTITGVTITAPGDSPNTDGIKIGLSKNLRIIDTNIGTGDDCVAILGGSSNILVENVKCGPGHGISVGSLGRNKNEKDITGLTVRDTVFEGTSDGVRIKTWEASQSKLVISDFLYENLHMNNVGYPINIDQKYCPHPPCKTNSASHVKIQGVKFKNIWGTSKNKEAVKLQCSDAFQCEDIELLDINLEYKGSDGPAISICKNAKISNMKKVFPPACRS